MNLKKLLKTIKLNESSISMFMGVVVFLIIGFLFVSYIRSNQGQIPDELLKDPNSIEVEVKKHTVSKGETLWTIAEKYYDNGFAWVDIATENKLANASQIEEGQTLVIPDLESTNEQIDEVGTDQDVAAETEITGDNTYTVQKGDNLWKIAVSEYGDGYRWVEIAKINKLENPNIIHSGNILVIPR